MRESGGQSEPGGGPASKPYSGLPESFADPSSVATVFELIVVSKTPAGGSGMGWPAQTETGAGAGTEARYRTVLAACLAAGTATEVHRQCRASRQHQPLRQPICHRNGERSGRFRVGVLGADLRVI